MGSMANQNPRLFAAINLCDRLSIRLDLGSGVKIGPEMIAVLEGIALTGSISATGRALRVSCRWTWELVEELNRCLGTPLIRTATGGGGGVLTKAGRVVLSSYRAIEMDAARQPVSTCWRSTELAP
jgi:molybdate transport system regulatory protein